MLYSLEYRIMNKIQKLINPKCYHCQNPLKIIFSVWLAESNAHKQI
jgi:hypothetical protein